MTPSHVAKLSTLKDRAVLWTDYPVYAQQREESEQRSWFQG